MKFCHRYLQDTRLTVVEINPDIIELRESFRIPPDVRTWTWESVEATADELQFELALECPRFLLPAGNSPP